MRSFSTDFGKRKGVEIVSLFLLTVPISSGRTNFYARGCDSPPSMIDRGAAKTPCNPSSDLRLFGSLEFGLSTEAASGIAYGWPSGLLGGPRSCFFSLLRCFYFSS